ncbi:hypothetical protein [Akkermansia sp.]|uniref:hypothetical protein n=1 Tax=Akkermansia sp. TaxID=1872421 RepID=UPI0025C12D03|nr:hypothetical protein [Akkermansia sp.]MCC8148787.1 hypothetical protein [Akkermansia sp.]
MSFLFQSLVVCLLFLFPGFGIFAQAVETSSDEVQPLKIKSETTVCSADFYIAKEQGKDVDEKTDKERKKLGMGEDVLLTLTGKPKGNVSQLQWKITKGEALASLPEKTEGLEEVTLTVSKRIQEKGEVEVTVTTSEGLKKNITFEILVPTKLTAAVPVKSDLPSDHNIIIVAADVKLTVEPTEVNFGNIQLIERDGGLTYVMPTPPPDPQKHEIKLGVPHTEHGCDDPRSIEQNNSFIDRVIYMANYNAIHGAKLPQEWFWTCDWKVHDGKGGKESTSDDILEVETVEQRFKVEYVKFQGMDGEFEEIQIAVRKFGRAISYDLCYHLMNYEYVWK